MKKLIVWFVLVAVCLCGCQSANVDPTPGSAPKPTLPFTQPSENSSIIPTFEIVIGTLPDNDVVIESIPTDFTESISWIQQQLNQEHLSQETLASAYETLLGMEGNSVAQELLSCFTVEERLFPICTATSTDHMDNTFTNTYRPTYELDDQGRVVQISSDGIYDFFKFFNYYGLSNTLRITYEEDQIQELTFYSGDNKAGIVTVDKRGSSSRLTLKTNDGEKTLKGSGTWGKGQFTLDLGTISMDWIYGKNFVHFDSNGRWKNYIFLMEFWDERRQAEIDSWSCKRDDEGRILTLKREYSDLMAERYSVDEYTFSYDEEGRLSSILAKYGKIKTDHGSENPTYAQKEFVFTYGPYYRYQPQN